MSSLSSASRSEPSASTSSIADKTATTSKEDKATRAAASLREREERVRLEKSKMDRNAQQARGHLGKEEAEREFGQLLIDAVRDHKVSSRCVSELMQSGIDGSRESQTRLTLTTRCRRCPKTLAPTTPP